MYHQTDNTYSTLSNPNRRNLNPVYFTRDSYYDGVTPEYSRRNCFWRACSSTIICGLVTVILIIFIIAVAWIIYRLHNVHMYEMPLVTSLAKALNFLG